MTLEDRLTYCNICSNRKFNIDNGILCGLTHEIPDFFPTCTGFIENPEDRDKVEKELNNRYRNYTKYSTWHNDFLKYRFLTNPQRINKYDEYLPTEVKVRIPNLNLIFISLFIGLLLAISIFKLQTIPVPYNYVLPGLLTILFVVISIIAYRQVKYGVIYAIINDQGIRAGRNLFIKWENVLCVMSKSEFKTNGKYMFPRYYLSIWRLGYSKVYTIQLEHFPFYMSWLLTVVEVYRKRHKKLNKR